MSRCVAIGERGWKRFRLAMAVDLPPHLKAQMCGRELDRLELLLEQIKAVEAERDALLNASEQTKVSAPPPMLLGVHGVGPLEFRFGPLV